MLTTIDILDRKEFTVYCGPGVNRKTLREAYTEGNLFFSVNRSYVGLAFGEPVVLDYFKILEDAIVAYENNPQFNRISAHYRGWGYNEECILHSDDYRPLDIGSHNEAFPI